MAEPQRRQPTRERREDRITMRIQPAHKALIERAAEIRGLSVTDYLTTVALADAEVTLADRLVFALDAETYDRVVAILERPAQDNPKLLALLERNAKSGWTVR